VLTKAHKCNRVLLTPTVHDGYQSHKVLQNDGIRLEGQTQIIVFNLDAGNQEVSGEVPAKDTMNTYFEASSARIADMNAMIPEATERDVRTTKIGHDLLSRLTLHARKIWIGTDALKPNEHW
jgi:hypothetical protein